MNQSASWRCLTLIITLILVVTHLTYAQPYQVYAVRFAKSTYPFTVGDWSETGSKTEKVGIDFMVWLIKGNDGKNILIDAGFLPNNPEASDFKIINYVRPDSALLKLNVKPEEITDIILSHPHWDHMGGITLFPNAKIWMQKEDFNYFVGAAWQKDGNNGGFYKNDVARLVDLNLKGKVILVDGDNNNIIPGITVFTGSKHTYNSQYVLVETGRTNVILASDNIWIYHNLEHMSAAANGGTLDRTAYINAMHRMKSMVSDQKFIIPGHDAELFNRFPTAADGVIEIK